MQTNQILSASLIDLVFDGRNKDYGAYELRKKYSKRISRALGITMIVTLLAFGGVTLAGSLNNGVKKFRINEGVTITSIDEKKPEKLPELEKPKPPETPTRTVPFNIPAIKPDDQVTNPPASQDEIDSSLIGDKRIAGNPDTSSHYMTPKDPDDGRGIIDVKPKDDEPRERVEVDARYPGNWKAFLERNLNASVPVDRDAPPGTYSVMIQFVVDKEGNVSEIKALTAHGYGMEEESIRVIKKATKWEPAFQNGVHVKAYRKQVITFQVLDE